MRTITAKQAIEAEGWTHAVVYEEDGLRVHNFYKDQETAERVAKCINEFFEHDWFEPVRIE